jgi:predicted nucleic acid-binding protein
MGSAYIDADVIVRFLTGDDPKKQQRATQLFERVERGEVQITTPVTTVADVVYVLSSKRLYAVERPKIAAMLIALLRLPGFAMKQSESVLRALTLYGSSDLDFGDALIAASMLTDGVDALYSYDRDFDKLTGIQRLEP